MPYRKAFRKLGINPNKYLCSIEALLTRIAKKKGLPHINPIVDLGNAISLKYTVPLGAHDITDCREDICVRLAKNEDIFLPFGGEKEEIPDAGEVVYAVGNQVRTRRWTWRQSEHGKIGPESANIFFPIDGFMNFNKEEVLMARDELVECLNHVFRCQTKTGFIKFKGNNASLEAVWLSLICNILLNNFFRDITYTTCKVPIRPESIFFPKVGSKIIAV